MIGYYVHHHGRGHLERARAVVARTSEPVTVLSSLRPDDEGGPWRDWVELPRDDEDGSAEHTAGDALHWAPLQSRGYAARMQAVAGWVAAARPRLLVVDVSVEVAGLARLLGVPVVVVAGAGVRDDAPHTLAHRAASLILAPWPARVYRPAHLEPYAGKTRYVGALSRFDGRAVPGPGRPGAVLVLLGGGGTLVGAADVQAAQDACAGTTWSTAGPGGGRWTADVWTADVWTALSRAEVVVTHAGQNALAEVAAARRPAVVVPQPRPFGEQHATAAALTAHGLAVSSPTWPAPRQWPALLAQARALGGAGWSVWNDGHGAQRAAALIEDSLRA